jgi:nucleoid DNA-binding protein
MNTGALIMTLTKIDIVEAVAEQNGYTKVRSFKVVETLLEIIKSTLVTFRCSGLLRDKINA